MSLAPITALPVSAAATALTLLVVRARLLDHPGERSLHTRPTPRGGGLGPAVACVALALSLAEVDGLRWPLVLVAGGFGLLGLADDVLAAIPSRVRLAIQLAIAAGAFPWVLGCMPGGPVAAVVLGLGAAIGIVAYANAFNFMDGVNGISAIHVLVVGTAWWLIADGSTAAGAAIVAWGALGFLPFNFPRASVFLGDVGSYFLGAWLVVVAIGGFHDGVAFEAMAAPLAPYLADTATTIVRRVRRGDSWHVAHREHAFQQLVALGWSHAAVALGVGAVVATCAGLGWVSTWAGPALRVGADVAVVVVAGAYVLALPRGIRALHRG